MEQIYFPLSKSFEIIILIIMLTYNHYSEVSHSETGVKCLQLKVLVLVLIANILKLSVSRAWLSRGFLRNELQMVPSIRLVGWLSNGKAWRHAVCIVESLAPLGPIRVECRRNFIFQRGQNMLHFHCDVVAWPKWSQLRIVFHTNTFLGSDNILQSWISAKWEWWLGVK